MNRPILSIVIPTFNRGALLEILLNSIVADAGTWPDDLELVVIDNASLDATAAVVEKFRAAGTPINYVRNSENIGMDGNLAACFDQARGKYFWQIGDDDVLYRGTLAYVLTLCRTREFGLLHLASDGFSDGAQSQVAARRLVDPPALVPCTSATLYRRANVFLTFISANVINRESILKAEPAFDARADLNSYVPQLAWIYKALLRNADHLLLGSPAFGALTNNTGGYRLIEVFGKNLLGITAKYLAPALPNAVRIMRNASLTRVVGNEMVSLRIRKDSANNFFEEKTSQVLREVFASSIFFSSLISPLASATGWKFKVYASALRFLNSLNRRIGYRLL